VIDELFDRSYQQGRAELHANFARLIAQLLCLSKFEARSSPFSTTPKEIAQCDPPSSQSRSR
jgi:hypothetical protein